MDKYYIGYINFLYKLHKIVYYCTGTKHNEIHITVQIGLVCQWKYFHQLGLITSYLPCVFIEHIMTQAIALDDILHL